MFRALRSRNFRSFFIGQGISMIGTWMQTIAMSWLVYRLTGSALLLGVVGFATQIPIFFLGALAGVFVDRYSRRKILILTQSLSMLQALILAVLVLTNTITVWVIIVLSIILGLINAIDLPARQTFTLEMVEDRENLGNAIALNSAVFNGSRLIGPSIAGIIIAVVGEGICFLINGLSFLALIIFLLSMKVKQFEIRGRESHIVEDLKEGFSYAFGFAPIRYLIILVALISIFGVPYTILMPVFAAEILKGDANTLGILMAASGVGALVGTLFLASRKTFMELTKIIVIATVIFGIGLILFSLSSFLVISLIMLMFTGFGMIVLMASGNTIIQNIVDDDKRGRVISLYAMAFSGVTPFGSLLAGGVANSIGAPTTLLIGGSCCIIAAIVFSTRFRYIQDMIRTAYNKRKR